MMLHSRKSGSVTSEYHKRHKLAIFQARYVLSVDVKSPSFERALHTGKIEVNFGYVAISGDAAVLVALQFADFDVIAIQYVQDSYMSCRWPFGEVIPAIGGHEEE